MIYGDKKIKNIGRGLLPSTRRKSAKVDKALASRKARRNTKQDLEYADIIERKRKRDMNYMVMERRNGDKLSVLRWAKAVTKDLTAPQDRVDYVKSVLPDNMIGRHALGHVENLPEFDIEDTSKYQIPLSNNFGNTWAERRDIWFDNFEKKLYEVIETGKLKAFNNAIKKTHSIHYVDEAKYILPNGNTCNAWQSGAIKEINYIRGHKIRVSDRVDHKHVYGSGTFHWEIVPCDHGPRVLLGLHDVVKFIHDVHGYRASDRWSQDIQLKNSLRHPSWMVAIRKFLDLGDI